ncbi:HlyD family efflux transporter periplasmic adaptor subunit [Rhizobium sp. TRM96647]|uniref:HlyD family secretion protein n=1 Tax=unclassified Rhizobium TaxID=2613769 RepID=UPI0021E982EF|nr:MULTISPECIES: HlyD family efflux transporter periplasmic adaptor subunit [unclassified Rhizobium]MCV3739486.1 HlyD family efflux transporter periplasmic adaptor subunit [Rhizobium sp. TRM96647]MCV3761189.1 HlyD family efflux transporter periplasmic adaptor subunit [Rhizobium sp. TRM96650]
MSRQGWIIAVLVTIVAGLAYYAWSSLRGSDLPAGIASGNGRIEAVEIDVSTKIAGRIADILVNEGDFVEAGQELARMDTAQLQAKHRQAQAELARAKIGVETAASLVRQQQAQLEAAVAVIAQREAEEDAALTRRNRSEQLLKTNTVSQQILDDDRANYQAAVAAVAAAKAQHAAAEAAVSSANAQVVDAKAAVESAEAAIESIDADLNDSVLRSPRAGRVQYRVAQPGEVLSSGGRVLNLVDLSDVSMTFFLPTEQAGRVALGSEVRLVLDAIPQYVIPAKATFVADVAQFTPKTVETQEERLKLMFRIKARIEPELLKQYIKQVKTGLPGLAYVKIAPDAEWPASLGNIVK